MSVNWYQSYNATEYRAVGTVVREINSDGIIY